MGKVWNLSPDVLFQQRRQPLGKALLHIGVDMCQILIVRRPLLRKFGGWNHCYIGMPLLNLIKKAQHVRTHGNIHNISENRVIPAGEQDNPAMRLRAVVEKIFKRTLLKIALVIHVKFFRALECASVEVPGERGVMSYLL